jgi:1,4-alpha-glucan branching enzyme
MKETLFNANQLDQTRIKRAFRWIVTFRDFPAGSYQEIFNSDAACYGGSNQGNGLGLHTENVAWMQHNQSLVITLPPLAGIVLQLN